MTTHQARVADFGNNKIWAIKLVRLLSGAGLKEAKDLTERGGTFAARVDAKSLVEIEQAQARGIRIVFDPPLDGSVPEAAPAGSGSFGVRYLFGDKKIQAIKLVRELTRCGLKEAKDLVEQQGTFVRARSRAEAEAIVRQFEAIGSQVELVSGGGRGESTDDLDEYDEYDEGLDF